VVLFLDANVLFAAAYSAEGNARAILRLAPLCGSTAASSTFAVEEAARNLRLKAPAAESELVHLMGGVTLAGGPDRRTLERASGHGLPEKDVPILAAAISLRAAVLVTGDRRHFGPLYGRRVGGVEILPSAETVARLLACLPLRAR
jgi:predicted nucleic acid-binding protein